MQQMQLLLSGNPNLNTIRSVVFFANQHYYSNITKIHFIDSNGTLHVNNQSIEGKRNSIVREFIPSATIESTIIETSHIHTEIPKLISEQLKMYSVDDIVVDLTNGTKYISNVLYASASLSQIKNLFFLQIVPSKLGTNPEDLQKDDYIIGKISTLENLEAIGKYIFFEIIYYRNKVDQILDAFKEAKFNRQFLRNMFASQLNSIISNYFSNSYAEAIGNVGQIMEEFSLELCNCIKNAARGKIKTKVPNTFDDSITWIRTEFCDPLRGKRNQGLLPYEEQMKELQAIDKMLDTIKVYRNISSHPYDLLRGSEEAKLVINNSFYILELLSRSGCFNVLHIR
jgi:hypothetical protein